MGASMSLARDDPPSFVLAITGGTRSFHCIRPTKHETQFAAFLGFNQNEIREKKKAKLPLLSVPSRGKYDPIKDTSRNRIDAMGNAIGKGM